MSTLRWWCAPVLATVMLIPGTHASSTQAQQDPYQVATFCTPVPSAQKQTVSVASGEELQKALDQAVAGDTILLAVGATFHPPATTDGSFVLRDRQIPRGQWVTIRAANQAFDADGPVPPGTRADKANAGLMPRVRATGANAAAIRADPRARGYRLIGLDIGADESVSQMSNLIELGTGKDTTAETEPSDIVIDRCYVHGNETGNFRRGVALNGVRLAVVDSWFEDFHDAHGDSQAIGGWNGPGPFKIVDNLLEAASENIMFGGADPAIAGLVPSDIEIRRNLSTKRLSWRTTGVPAKNAFELKNARRVLVDGNMFERVWSSGQDGTAIVLKSTNQDGRCTWCVTEYVTFSNNIVRAAASGVVINAAESGARGLPSPRSANHIRLQNVLFEEIGAREWGGGGKLLRVFGGVSNLEITHVTSAGNPGGILDPRDEADVNPYLVFSYNIVERMYYGIGTGGNEGTATLAKNFGPFVYKQNVLVNTSRTTDQAIGDGALTSRYPPSTIVAPDWGAVAFEKGTYKLAANSPYRQAGDDGKHPGVDVDALTAAQRGPDSSACGGARSKPAPRQ